MWEERKVEIPEGAKPEDLIKVPQNAQYFAAMGAIEFGKAKRTASAATRATKSWCTTSTSAARKRRPSRALLAGHLEDGA
jgi:hypothetical protein